MCGEIILFRLLSVFFGHKFFRLGSIFLTSKVFVRQHARGTRAGEGRRKYLASTEAGPPIYLTCAQRFHPRRVKVIAAWAL